MTTTLSQIHELEARIQQLRSQQLLELKEALAASRKTVADLEAQIAGITGGQAPVAPTRTKLTSEEIRSRILKALASSPMGMSQKEISQKADVPYNTVVLFLKTNAQSFKTTGALKAKRYFLR